MAIYRIEYHQKSLNEFFTHDVSAKEDSIAIDKFIEWANTRYSFKRDNVKLPGHIAIARVFKKIRMSETDTLLTNKIYTWQQLHEVVAK